MNKHIRHVGFDVDSEKIAVAVAEPGGEVRSVGAIPHQSESVRRLVKKLGPAKRLRVCYEAGPHGYGLYWQLRELGVHCDVVAPTLVPVKAGDRVKTNRRDALKLARSYRSGDLTPVWVPDAEHEALRDLVRAREVAKKDQLRARHRLGKFLLRRGLRAGAGVKNWTTTAPGLGADAALRAAGAGGHVSGLPARGGARGGEDRAAGESDRPGGGESLGGQKGPGGGAAGAAGDQADHGGDDRGGAGRGVPLRAAEAADGLQRHGLERRLDGRAGSGALEDHQDGQRPPAAGRRRGGLGLPVPPSDVAGAQEAAGRAERGGQGDRLEGSAPAVLPVPTAAGEGQAQAGGRSRRWEGSFSGFIWAIGMQVEKEQQLRRGRAA